jgi:putative LysE/RhtB family amino acid efflux pump
MLTLANPMTILSFAAIFAGLGGMGDSKRSSAVVAGVFAGSACWWLLLSAVTGRVGRHLSTIQTLWINRACGATLIGFALYALANNLSGG